MVHDCGASIDGPRCLGRGIVAARWGSLPPAAPDGDVQDRGELRPADARESHRGNAARLRGTGRGESSRRRIFPRAPNARSDRGGAVPRAGARARDRCRSAPRLRERTSRRRDPPLRGNAPAPQDRHSLECDDRLERCARQDFADRPAARTRTGGESLLWAYAHRGVPVHALQHDPRAEPRCLSGDCRTHLTRDRSRGLPIAGELRGVQEGAAALLPPGAR